MVKNFLYKIFYQHFIFYPSPASLNLSWNFGFIAGVCLVIQLISGIFLAAHYCSDVTAAFNSVEFIMREVNCGWLLRYVHANGASFFLIAVYIHMARGIYYRSYLGGREKVWYSGVLIFLVLMATAFSGYVLPWGQMSFRGATVITNSVSALPVIGKSITFWLWGGFAVSGATLSRFFVLHFLLPFVVLGLVVLHLGFVHEVGSNSAVFFGLEGFEVIPFYPYFLLKDFFILLAFLTCFSFFVFFEPNYLGHPDNYVRANPLSTPPHIVPEWYSSPFYAMLRSVPNKLGGILYMFGSIFILFFLPVLTESLSKTNTRMSFCSFSWEAPFYDLAFFFWILTVFVLGWVGSKPIVRPYFLLGAHISMYYFGFFFLYFKPLSFFKNFFWEKKK